MLYPELIALENSNLITQYCAMRLWDHKPTRLPPHIIPKRRNSFFCLFVALASPYKKSKHENSFNGYAPTSLLNFMNTIFNGRVDVTIFRKLKPQVMLNYLGLLLL
jgi:hypothetical protein